MPRLHLETTADVPENADIPDILEALGARLAQQSGVDSDRIRAYHSLRSVWYVGEGAPPGFVHLTLFVIAGRDPLWRKQTAEAMMNVLKEGFKMSLDANEVAITVDVREMDPSSYTRP